ncbi:MAG: hypothetical protein COA79_17705 [Planctomycetota bacterium]|nr:MAG: hypothetical protein COA79_17705 [Planctomycetota bacterium]
MKTSELICQSTQYEESGFIQIKQLFSKDQCEEIKNISKRICAENEHAPSGVHVFHVDQMPKDIQKYICGQSIASILKTIIGPEIEFLSFKPVFKSAKVHFGTPWHQDWAYWKGSHKISIWIALDEATIENGCLRIIPGSHKNFREHARPGSNNGFDNRIMDGQILDEEIVDVPLNVGDAIFFHDCLMHSSYENTIGLDRWSLIPTYRDKSLNHLESTNMENFTMGTILL